MCTPAVTLKGVSTAFGLGMELFSNAQNTKAEAKNLKYKTQIAINNANTARAEALRQAQMGIDSARLEKIQGLKEAKLQMAKNSANGLDIASSTNMQNYQDIIDNSNLNALNVQKDYNLKADSYFNKASEYMNQIQGYRNDYNNSVFKNAMNSLGSVKKVAQSWYGGRVSNTEGVL